MGFFNRQESNPSGQEDAQNQFGGSDILKRTLSGRRRAEVADTGFKAEVDQRDERLNPPTPEVSGDSQESTTEGRTESVQLNLARELNEVSKIMDENVEEAQKRVDGYGESAKSLHDVTDALTAFQLPKGEGLGISLGRESLAGKAAEEIALRSLLEALPEANENNNYIQVTKEARKTAIANQGVWDQLSTHAKLDVQRKLHEAILQKVSKHPKLQSINVKRKIVNFIERRVDDLTPHDSLVDTYEELRQVVGVIRAEVVEKGGHAESVIRDIVSEASSETAGSVESILEIATIQVKNAEAAINKLPDGAVKDHFLNLIKEVKFQFLVVEDEDRFDAYHGIKKDQRILELIKEVSKKLSIFDAIKRGDANDVAVRTLMKLPNAGVDLAVLIPRIQEVNKLGRVTFGGVEKASRQAIDAVNFISREKGLVLEAGNTGTLRGARERVRAFTQRAEEVTNLIDELKGIDTVNAGSLDALEGFRIALPFLRKVKTIAESRTLSAMGIDESHLSEEQQQPIVELCIELNEKAEAVNNAEAEARGQEILLQIAVDNIKQVYNVDDEQAKALLSEEGLKKWFDKEKDETSPGLRGIHQRLTRRLRKGVSNQEQGLLKRVSPGEMLGIGIDNNGNVVLSETGTQYAEALGRLDNAIGENGELNTDADTLGKDIALLRSLGLRVGAGSTMDKIRNLVTRGELLTTEAMKKLEKLQDLVENGVVGVIEIAAVAATVVVAKEIVEGVGGLLEAGMDNMSDSIRLTLDHLRESVTGVEGAVDVARDTLAQNDLRDPQFIGGANDVARNAQHAYDVGILSSAQSTLSSLQNIISSNVSMLSRTNALGNFGQRLSESGIVNTAAGLTLGAVVAETNARTLQLGTKISNGISGLRASMARARGERNYLTVEEAWQEIADSSRTEASEDNAIFDKNKAEAETLKALIDEAAKSGTAIEELLKTRIDTLTNK